LDARGLPQGGTGIVGMKERAKKLGGTVLVESQPGKGARILVQIPVGKTIPAEVYS
jgi:signal transduction histidine kinase